MVDGQARTVESILIIPGQILVYRINAKATTYPIITIPWNNFQPQRRQIHWQNLANNKSFQLLQLCHT